jgi:hypothetical protein
MALTKVFEEAGMRSTGIKTVRQYYVDSAEQYLVIAQVEKLSGKPISKMRVPFGSAPERIKELVGSK